MKKNGCGFAFRIQNNSVIIIVIVIIVVVLVVVAHIVLCVFGLSSHRVTRSRGEPSHHHPARKKNHIQPASYTHTHTHTNVMVEGQLTGTDTK